MIESTIEPIYKIDDLLIALKENSRSAYTSILQSVEFDKEELLPYQSWSSLGYQRNCIAENENFELILLCWEAYQSTAIHDHGGEECWVKVLDGLFEEIIYTLDQNGIPIPEKTVLLNQGEVCYIDDFMGLHKLKNCIEERKMTLHLYAKPIRSCQVYDRKSETFSKKKLTYHTKVKR